MTEPTWVFGYGSLIWRPDFAFLDRQRAALAGFERRFWQGSHDHRGVPEAPGRVVTLIERSDAVVDGVAYLIEPHVFEHLDYREKNGYDRFDVELEFADGPRRGVVYIAPTDNHAFLGPASIDAIARQIQSSAGPSGHNVDYLLELARALRALGCHDEHVFELETSVKTLDGREPFV